MADENGPANGPANGTANGQITIDGLKQEVEGLRQELALMRQDRDAWRERALPAENNELFLHRQLAPFQSAEMERMAAENAALKARAAQAVERESERENAELAGSGKGSA